MSKIMTIYEEAEFDISAEDVCQFITRHADEIDKADIRKALFGEEPGTDDGSLLDTMKRELAAKIATRYTFAELMEMESQKEEL